MSARMPARRLAQSALALRPRPRPWTAPTALPTAARRAASTNPPPDKDLANPLLEKYLAQQEAQRAAATAAHDGPAPKADALVRRDGSTYSVPSPLFDPERLVPGFRPDASAADKAALKARAEQRRLAAEREDEKRLLSSNLDPDPAARRRLERKLVIRSLTKHGRMTKAATIARTERTSLYKSHFLPTSVKKMQKILRQIAGKTVSDALVQLRFSPKKIARDILKGLLIAQDEAIAGRGMGLGDKHALSKWTAQRNEVAATLANLDETAPAAPRAAQLIELKSGKKKLVKDPTEIYIDQAWCGRGEHWSTPEFRARGKVNMLKHRTTSFTFLLKEEATRMRISDEIQKKRANRKLWVALPDRPVTAQRQYCLW